MTVVYGDTDHIQAGRWWFFPEKVTLPGHEDMQLWQLHRTLDGHGAATVFPSHEEHWEATSREKFMEFARRWVEENVDTVAPDVG